MADTTDPTMLSSSRLHELLHYEPGTGLFTWKASRPKAVSGRLAGTVHRSSGYVYIGVDGGKYTAHRLAWLYMNGRWPTEHVDHINGDRSDNRYDNLREASPMVNAQNHRKPRSTSKTGVLGVTKIGKKFQAAICVKGKQVKLGYFDTCDQARDAYLLAKRAYHAGCTI